MESSRIVNHELVVANGSDCPSSFSLVSELIKYWSLTERAGK